MNKQRPSTAAALTMVAFAASCIGLLIYLWISFGGSLPLTPQGYRFSVEFAQAVELGSNAQVEISGVPIGNVVSVGLDHRTGLARAVIQVDNKFAPRPADTRAILRAKTLLGETYVELSAGDPAGPKLRDGGTLPQAQVAPHRRARPDLLHLRPDHATGVRDLAAAVGDRAHQPRRAVQRRLCRPVPVRHQRRLGAVSAASSGGGDEHAAPRRRRGVRGAEATAPAELQSFRAQQQLGVRRHRGARHRAGRRPSRPSRPSSPRRARRSTGWPASQSRPSP